MKEMDDALNSSDLEQSQEVLRKLNDMEEIAEQTGGFYEWIADSNSMQKIYEKIYKEQKELYLLEYETLVELEAMDFYNVYLKYKQETRVARCISEFSPKS